MTKKLQIAQNTSEEELNTVDVTFSTTKDVDEFMKDIDDAEGTEKKEFLKIITKDLESIKTATNFTEAAKKTLQEYMVVKNTKNESFKAIAMATSDYALNVHIKPDVIPYLYQNILNKMEEKVVADKLKAEKKELLKNDEYVDESGELNDKWKEELDEMEEKLEDTYDQGTIEFVKTEEKTKEEEAATEKKWFWGKITWFFAKWLSTISTRISSGSKIGTGIWKRRTGMKKSGQQNVKDLVWFFSDDAALKQWLASLDKVTAADVIAGEKIIKSEAAATIAKNAVTKTVTEAVKNAA